MRRGVTLPEVLVGLAVAAVLLGLSLAAAQRVREAANRLRCADNLHQIGLALHSHHDARHRFPSGGTGWWMPPTYVGTAAARPPEQFAGWAFQLLPFVEQGNLYRDPGAVRTTPVALYFCPSRRAPLVGTVPGVPGIVPGALCDYACAAGPGGEYGGSGGDRGTIVRNPARVTRYDVTDGLSNTFVVGEKRLNPDLYRVGDWNDNEGFTDGWDNDVMCLWSSPLGRDERRHMHYEFGSAHPSGMAALFADGSVRWLRYDLPPWVLAAAGDRRDGVKPVFE